MHLDYNRDENDLKLAIGEFEECLKNRDRGEYPAEWAAAKVNLAVAHFRSKGKNHFDAAREDLDEVVQNSDQGISTDLRCTAQFNLGLVYLEIPDGDTAKDLAEAMQHFQWAMDHSQNETKSLYSRYLAETRQRLRNSPH